VRPWTTKRAVTPRVWRMVLIAVFLRAAYALLFVVQPTPPTAMPVGVWGRTSGDTASYIDPVDNLLSTGRYTPDFRMPGYAVPYLAFRLCLGPVASLNSLLVLQVLLSAISVVALAVLATRAFPTVREAEMWTFWAFSVSTYTAVYDAYLLTESFATASLILAVSLLLAARERRSLPLYAVSGLLLAWMIFLRPALGGLLPLLVAWLGITCPHRQRARLAPALGLLVVPFLLADGAWIVRNWRTHRVFMPLAPRFAPYYTDLDLSLFRFLQSWGGSLVHWNPTAEIIWFEHMKTPGYAAPREAVEAISFPEDIYTSRFSYADLVRVRAELLALRDPKLPLSEHNAMEARIATELQSYAESIRTEKPLVYYVKAPLRLLRRFLVHSGTQNLIGRRFWESSVLERVFRLGMTLLYWAVLAFFVVAVVWLTLTRRWTPGSALVSVIVVYVVFVHVVLFRTDESRYFVPAYPFVLCLGTASVARAVYALHLAERPS
jgi:hypothetical protein